MNGCAVSSGATASSHDNSTQRPRPGRSGARPPNAAVMRVAKVLPLFVFLSTSCITQQDPAFRRTCLSEAQSDWASVQESTEEVVDLRAQLKGNPALNHAASLVSFDRWFASADRAQLLYCRVPQFPNSCGSSVATFVNRHGSWSQDEEAMLVVCSD
jgi:hypothetical protein